MKGDYKCAAFFAIYILLACGTVANGTGKGECQPGLAHELFGSPELEAPIPAPAYFHLALPPAPIEVTGDDQKNINMKLPDGGLKPVVGAHNIQLFRSTRGKPELADGDGWTYAHQHDLAVWRGRLYAVWALGKTNEIEQQYRLVYSTSTDGIHWSALADLFPTDIAWYCRFYFYRAANGRMLVFCPYRSANAKSFFPKNLLVREITANHRLGEIYTLINLDGAVPEQLPFFQTANDPDFVAACREAAGNNLLLEQQDLGVLLGDSRMPWHKNPSDGGGWPFGKAFCFYHRKDGAVVGLCKMGFATLSEDAGQSWSKPVQPPTLITGGAKIWGQRTPDGRYALVYNPVGSIETRWPHVLVHGDDGREFRDMRAVHGELPRRRYEGKSKDFGAQYTRGLAEWADDGTFAGNKKAMWMVYSVNKEDIWVARVPLPVKPDETVFSSDDFATFAPGAVVPGWNLYSPKWAPVSVVDDRGKRSLELRDGDPFDYARALRTFPEAAKVHTELRLRPAQANARLEIDLCSADGRRPVRICLTETGLIQAADGETPRNLGKYAAGKGLTIVVTTDLAAGSYTVRVNNLPAQSLAVAEPDCRRVQRLSLRTGTWRGLGDGGAVEPAADVPAAEPAVFRTESVAVRKLE